MRVSVLVGLVVVWAGPALADEGLWTFDGLPKAQLEKAYGFVPDQAWLDRVRLASVRLSGCSAGIVSGKGLVQTNHHCVMDCIQELAADGQDIDMTPVLAATEAEERQCPGVEAEIVTAITDVTATVVAATQGLSGEAFTAARDGAIAKVEETCDAAQEDGYCEVIVLYSGGKYALHTYRTYDDVRLVLGPETAAGSFGGDPDNFSFPRFAYDVAFLRLYEDGKPAATPDHFVWRSEPLSDGEMLFVSGNPGQTGRLWAVSTMELLTEAYFPYQLMTGAELRGQLSSFAERGPDEALQASALLHQIENTYKSDRGEFTVLTEPGFVEALQKREDDLKSRVAANPAYAAEIGDPWADIVVADIQQRKLFNRYRLVEFDAGGYSDLFYMAKEIVRATEEAGKAEDDRLEGYSNGDLEQIAADMEVDSEVDPEIEEMLIAFWLSRAREYLTVDHPLTKLLLGRESPEGLAHRLVSETKIGDPAERTRLLKGGAAAVAASTDPLIVYVRSIDKEARALAETFRTTVREPKDHALERLARANFLVFGSAIYPDATGSLRLNYGKVDGWTEPDGRRVPPFTTFAGLYDRATGAAPFKLAPLWEAARDKLNPATIFNVSTDNDTIGGNSGSPTIDREGRIVGALFDGNLHGFGGFYQFDAALNRSVVIAGTAIEEALVKVYGLQRIVDELKQP